MSARHLAKCCGREMTTANQLMEFVREDLLPRHEYVDVREDFSFSRCRDLEPEVFSTEAVSRPNKDRKV